MRWTKMWTTALAQRAMLLPILGPTPMRLLPRESFNQTPIAACHLYVKFFLCHVMCCDAFFADETKLQRSAFCTTFPTPMPPPVMMVWVSFVLSPFFSIQMHRPSRAESTAAGDDHVPLQKFIHIVKKWNSFRQHYTVKELAVALQFFVSGSGSQAAAAAGGGGGGGRNKGQASARSVANRLWFGKFLYGPVGRARVVVQSLIANPIFSWATITSSIFYVPLLGFTVSVLDTPPSDGGGGGAAAAAADDDDNVQNLTANGEVVLTWSEAVYWTEYIVWAFLLLFAVEFALKLFAHTPHRFWNHYDLGLRYINRVDLTMFCSCTTA